MKKIIIIKYAELSTKKDNINFFIKTLKKNIEYALINLNINLNFDKGRMFIETDDYELTIKKLKKIFGIQKFVMGYKLDNNKFENIEHEAISILKSQKFSTFKVETKRSFKDYPLNSMEISKKIGASVLKNLDNKKVDVKNPDILLKIEIRKDESLIYFNEIEGLKGYPVSTLGKGLLMLSGGIDSPVAFYLACKRGIKIEAIYFESPPHTSIEARNKVLKLAEILAEYNLDVKIHIINFTKIQEEIYKNINHDYLITIMRRMMYRISEKIAIKNNCKVIINGESVGQVASQTLTSMSVINEVVKMPVIRPVSCLDKNDIINISKKIETYETSILPYEDCCTIFVPNHPVINPDLNLAKNYENLIDFENLIKEAIKNEEIIKLKINDKNSNYEDIL